MNLARLLNLALLSALLLASPLQSATAQLDAAPQALLDSVEHCKVEVTYDTSALPADDLASPTVQAFIANAVALAEEDFIPLRLLLYPGEPVPGKLSTKLVFIRQEDGIAWTSGGEITINMKWFADRPDDVGAVYHELAHVIQSYTDNPRGGDYGWLVEGIADWARYFHYEGHDLAYYKDAAPGSYRDGYTNAARFLEWLRLGKNPQVVTLLNAWLAEGGYNAAADWQELCGAGLDELWAEYAAAVEH